jgi:hypothetical protein
MDEPSTSTRNFRRSSIKMDDPSDKYGKLYEESMNPFTQFHRKVNLERISVNQKLTASNRKRIVDIMH